MDYYARAKKFNTKKSLGQNFLIDEKIINFIVDSANLTKEDTVLEIGAGIGFVTELLAQKAKKVYAVEIDKQAISVLKKLPFDNIEIIEQDILKTNIKEIAGEEKIKIVANIPYYITSPILSHLLGEVDEIDNKNLCAIKEIILMVQYEVARRIVATNKSKNKEFGLLSILCNFNCDTEYLKDVNSKCFMPRPKVNSGIVRITPSENKKYLVKDLKMFRKITKAAFQTRRKTLKNSLLIAGFDKTLIEKTISELGWDSNIRAEKLSIEDFCRLTDYL